MEGEEPLLNFGLTPAELLALATIHHNIDAALYAMEEAFGETKQYSGKLTEANLPSQGEIMILKAKVHFYLRTLEILSHNPIARDSILISQLIVRQRAMLEALEHCAHSPIDNLSEERRAFRERAEEEGLFDPDGAFFLDMGTQGSIRVKRDRPTIQKLITLAETCNIDLLDQFVTHPICLRKSTIVPWYHPHHLDEGMQWTTLGQWLQNTRMA